MPTNSSVTPTAKGRQGFAALDADQRREIASQGGHAVQAKGTAHLWTADEARAWRMWRGLDGSVNIVNTQGEYVCLVGREGGPDSERIQADARQIAAASDLLAAAKFALSVLRHNGLFELSERLAEEKLVAAIANAEGRS